MVDTRFSATFGLVVRKHRRKRGISQEALAEQADIHRTYVGLLERGLRAAGLDVAHRIAAALGVPLSKLVAETDREWARKGKA